LTEWVPETNVLAEAVNGGTIKLSLAKHLGLPASPACSHWGGLQKPEFTATEWPLRLK